MKTVRSLIIAPTAILLVACGTTVQVTGSPQAPVSKTEVFQLQVVDGSKGLAGHAGPGAWLNQVTTPEDGRRKAVADAITKFSDHIQAAGFRVSNDAQASGDSSPRVVLALRGVRRDVIAGWITDGATVSLKRSDAGPAECEVTVRGTLVNPAVERMVSDVASAFVDRCLRS